MAKTKKQYMEEWYRRYLGRAPEPAAIQAWNERADITPEQRLQEILSSPERQQYLQQTAQQRVLPVYQPAMQKISAQQQQLQNQKALGLQQIGQQKSSVEDYFNELMKQLELQQPRAERALTTKMSRLGLLRSGATAAGLGEIARTTTEQRQQAERKKAEQLAELALRQTGVEQTYATGEQQLAAQRGLLEAKKAQQIQDIIDTLTQQGEAGLAQTQAEMQREAEYQRQLAEEKLKYALAIPAGQAVDIPGLGRIEGMAQPQPVQRKTSVVTANGRKVLIDSQTGEKIADLGRAYKTATRAAAKQEKKKSRTSVLTDLKSDIENFYRQGLHKEEFATENKLIPALKEAYPELTMAEITNWVYKLRKPYENQ